MLQINGVILLQLKSYNIAILYYSFFFVKNICTKNWTKMNDKNSKILTSLSELHIHLFNFLAYRDNVISEHT